MKRAKRRTSFSGADFVPMGKLRGNFQMKKGQSMRAIRLSMIVAHGGNFLSRITKQWGHKHAYIMLTGSWLRVKTGQKDLCYHHCQWCCHLSCVCIYIFTTCHTSKKNHKIILCPYFTSHLLCAHFIYTSLIHSFGCKLKRANSAELYFYIM